MALLESSICLAISSAFESTGVLGVEGPPRAFQACGLSTLGAVVLRSRRTSNMGLGYRICFVYARLIVGIETPLVILLGGLDHRNPRPQHETVIRACILHGTVQRGV